MRKPLALRSPIPRRRSKPRRGRLVDRNFLTWMHTQPCLVTGEWPVTVHHVRFCGSPKNDRRTIALVARLHMRGCEQPGIPCVERGKRVFEEFHGVNIEHAIANYNRRFDLENTNS